MQPMGTHACLNWVVTHCSMTRDQALVNVCSSALLSRPGAVEYASSVKNRTSSSFERYLRPSDMLTTGGICAQRCMWHGWLT